MARQERQPEGRYPLGVTNPGDFARLVESHPLYKPKDSMTYGDLLTIELRLIQVRSFTEINHCANEIGFDLLRDIEYRTEAAILEDLRIPRA